MILALALSPSLDVTYEVDELRRGDITRPTAVTRVAGGKALNAARVARALGADVRAIVALGGHSGSWVADLLTADGVEGFVVPIAAETRMSSAIVEAHGEASSTDLYEPASPLTALEWDAFRARALAERGDRVALSGSLPRGVETDAVAGLLRELRARGSRVAVDCSGPGLAALGAEADLVKVNRAEASELLGDVADAQAAARGLRERWGCDVVVTDGIRGGAALIEGEEYALPAPTVRGRFSAGSGDSFLGGLLAGFERGLAASDALDLARDAAERNARVPGQGVLAPPAR